ncbi:hypothetical protein [Fluviicola sp.]|jgi:hypothetical protein|uniref:hypothetical protein n=1 Tax=Fluviicola sp. TaxID=1917219 RepID=UPI0028239521|nr:hypothetical protein [Fluviicola sp.]MDR0801486.1 hypothetical protein [Fluviicola sp.]
MKKSEVPQDKSALEYFTREVCYVKNEDGHYDTELSTGWEAKKVALDEAWKEIKQRTFDAREKIKRGESSPILFFMEEKLMDFTVLASYTGIWKFRIKRHLKPGVFQKLNDSVLKRYADAFEVSVNELKNFKA